LEQKTKEIVERLRACSKKLSVPATLALNVVNAGDAISRVLEIGYRPKLFQDIRQQWQDVSAIEWDCRQAASLIESLSERVGELERPPVANASACEDCGRPYDGPGFPDLIIPLAIWKQISTHGDETGLLCPSCLIARLDRAGLESVPAAFAGRAVESVTYETMAALRESENRALLSKQEER
jgi:hypothetical protein